MLCTCTSYRSIERNWISECVCDNMSANTEYAIVLSLHAHRTGHWYSIGTVQSPSLLHYPTGCWLCLSAWFLTRWKVCRALVNPIETASVKEAETMYWSITSGIKNLRMHVKSHKLMGILWAHAGTIGCIGLKERCHTPGSQAFIYKNYVQKPVP